MSAPISSPESNKNEAGHLPDAASLPDKERGGDDTEGTADQDLEYATPLRLIIGMCTLSLSTLIAALDLGIVATAIAKITSDFHALDGPTTSELSEPPAVFLDPVIRVSNPGARGKKQTTVRRNTGQNLGRTSFAPGANTVESSLHIPAGQTRKDSFRNSKRILRNRQQQSNSSVADTANELQDIDCLGNHSPAAGEGRNIAHGCTDVHSSRPSIDCDESESAIGIAQKLFELGRQHIDEQATSAIPGYRASTGAVGGRTATVGQRLPISSILAAQLPPVELVYVLLEDYFDAIHWFSLAVYEPKFRKRLQSIADGFAYPSEKPFLLLLAVMLGMGAWYRSQRSTTGPAADDIDWRTWSADLLKLVESNVVELMDQPSVTAAQTCILLGSHHVYHGRPNFSFSLLGATIKISQASGLHREPARGNFEDIEERKRVWWTIYTWDRFASITYGRPLGINDKDCNLNMPADVLENPYFIAPRSDRGYTVCYSTYQRELNRLYLITSSALEAIFGSRTSGSSKELAGDAYLAMVRDTTQKLQRWRSQLPDHLVLDPQRDFEPTSSLDLRAHALQSLSLDLTYNNLLIVLHRPLLARQVDHISTSTQSPGRSEADSPICRSTAASSGPTNIPFEAVPSRTPIASSVYWLNAALRTSQVTELPVLAQLATDSHLVAFLAINLFNAAIVLAVIALSDPLSDTAQAVKRTMTRILRLQDVLGKRSALSKQSVTVLRNVVTLLLRRETDAILGPITGTDQHMSHQALAGTPLLSVEDTLRLPLDAMLDVSDPLAGRQAWPDLDRAHRLNDSLTSVQYALRPGDDRSFNLHAGGDGYRPREVLQESMRPDDVWQLSAEHDSNHPDVPPVAIENNYDGNGERGLYWLWDLAWNGVDM
ncbi:hypothetical protein EYZ11_003339 [Aspergillus tanneri]|uniref:Xylanolytic transcriptional activator regulatory domain-containing protein n=1 Tax=Aspergillus tanneri TaxID=1220188 RepID=A0A4V3UQ05_9EURO|nr:hypothetical protein EYZ11_003339 [Aspergillus tanneri]